MEQVSEQQIAFILRQAEEGVPVGEVCRKVGISERTYYRWRKRYGGRMLSEMKRLKQLEEEHATDNAYIESFNGSFRDECLNAHWFLSLDDAREEIETWRRD